MYDKLVIILSSFLKIKRGEEKPVLTSIFNDPFDNHRIKKLPIELNLVCFISTVSFSENINIVKGATMTGFLIH